MSKEATSNNAARSPLVDVAMNYVSEVEKDVGPDVLDIIRQTFGQYISGQKDHDEISYVLLQHLDSVSPLEKIDSILRLAEVPAPPSPNGTMILDSDDNKTSINNNSNNRKKTRSWTNDEDQRLLMGVHLYGLENWTLVAQFVGNGRTRSMCSQRWIRVLDPRISKAHWTEEEDKQLLQLVQLYGEKSWMKIATKLGNRSDVQCRYHFQQLQRLPGTSMATTTVTTAAPTVTTITTNVANVTPITANVMNDENNIKSCNSFSNASNIFVTPTAAPIKQYPAASAFPELVLPEQASQCQQTAPETESELPPLTEHELQMRLDEPFGLEESFDFWKSDPMFDSSFWAC